MERFLWICLGGAAGSGARYVVATWAAERFGAAFPFGILLVNLIGCFLMGFIVQLGLSWSWSPTLRAGLTVGVLGGLTTYSTFNHDTSALLQQGAVVAGLANLTATVLGGFVAGWCGIAAARAVVGP